MNSIRFIGLDTYSVVGGLQNFNRRLMANLAFLGETQGLNVRAHLMRDVERDVPPELRSRTEGHGSDRVGFFSSVVREATATDILLVGHINLAPVAWIAKLCNPKLRLILFVHGDEVWNDPAHRKMRPYEPFLLTPFDCVASVSNYTAKRMCKPYRVPPSKFTLFPNAIDDKPIQSALPKIPGSLLVVSRLGRGDRQKNIHETIRAFDLVVKRLPSATLQIVGDGPMRTELEELAQELGLGDRVVFRGRVSDAELAQAYAESQAFAMPSSKEGFGIVYLEAWQYGLPVICSTEGASHEIISDGIDGFARDPADIQGLAEAIHTLLADPQHARSMGETGRRKVSENYLNQHFRTNLTQLLAGAGTK